MCLENHIKIALYAFTPIKFLSCFISNFLNRYLQNNRPKSIHERLYEEHNQKKLRERLDALLSTQKNQSVHNQK